MRENFAGVLSRQFVRVEYLPPLFTVQTVSSENVQDGYEIHRVRLPQEKGGRKES